MDGRRNNKGTKGNNGGRPPKADELKMIEAMDKAIKPAAVWHKLAFLIELGDVQAIKLYLNYRFGMPKQKLESDKPLDMTIRVIDDTE